jgi:FAD:protein FMN transferase
MNRRDFLSACAAPSPGPETTLLRFARSAMATVFEVLLPWGTLDADVAANAVLDLIDRLESQLTVYRETSEVSRLNRLAAHAPAPVGPALFNLLALATRITAQTSGAFDVSAGPLIKSWGFFRRQGRVPSSDELAATMKTVGMSRIGLDAERRSVRYLRPGVEINLASIGKGYALDRAGEVLRKEFGFTSALLNGGNSSVLAIGNPANDSRGWSVGLRNPLVPEERLAVVRLRGRAMATSAATYQNFAYNGQKLGHLIDPRTGRPATGMRLACAFAPSAAEADALATAFYVLGPDGTRRYCETHREIGAIVLKDEPKAMLEAINLPPGDLNPAPARIASAELLWELA